MSAEHGRDKKRLTCRSCGYELTGIGYFAGEKETNEMKRVVEFYFPKYTATMIIGQ
jgi:hypothetical protein